MANDGSRRTFVAGGLAAALPFSARSYAQIVGANDRIQIGEIGCGHRAGGHRAMRKKSAATDPKFDVHSVCDLWSVNRERAAADVQRLFGAKPKTYKYSEEMLADKELDAVMIGTGDHQYARILAEVVRAGKDCYCEKPMANTLEDALTVRDGTSRRIRTSPRFGNRIRTGNAGCWGGRRGRSIRESISNSGFSRTTPAALPINGIATGPD